MTMWRTSFATRSGAFIAGVGFLLSPALASADTIADLQARVQALLAQIAQLEAISTGGVNTIPASAAHAAATSCVDLSSSFGLNATDAGTGGDVSRLQRFLTQVGVYTGSITGRVGPLTEGAIQRWQSAHGIVSSGTANSTGYGYVGSRTREAMACSSVNQGDTAAINVPQAIVPSTNIPSTVVPNEWPPEGIADISRWRAFTLNGCNADSFGTHPALGDIYIARQINSTVGDPGCEGRNGFSLAYQRMNWSTMSLELGATLLDTSRGAVTLGDGNRITTAYDASIMLYNSTIWIAFECGTTPDSGYRTASTCMGPLNHDMTLDLARTGVVVYGAASGGFIYSASVPKLLLFNGTPYLYWTAVQMTDSASSQWVSATTRGAALESAQGGLRVRGSGGVASPAFSAASTEVFGLESNDARSNSLADLFQVLTDGTHVYVTGARGGSGCLTPLSASEGCYRLMIGRTTSPLGERIFNQGLAPDNTLPSGAQEYTRFVFRPSDQSTQLHGYFIHHGPRTIAWQTSLMRSESAPVGYDVESAMRGASAAPAAPATVTATCAANNTSATVSWTAVAGVSTYAPRVDTGDTTSACPTGWTRTGTQCYSNSVSATSVTLTIVPGRSYGAWVHGVGSNGALSATATHVTNSSFSCPATAAPTCTPLAPATQTLACPAGQTGSIVQTRASSCAVGATAPTWGAWTTVSNTCVTPTPTCTPLASQSQTLSCPAGQTGSITQSRISSCAAGASSPTWGAWVTNTNTCSTPSPTCTPQPSQTQTLSCPVGQTGSITQSRVSTCAVGASSPTWGQWQTTTNTCTTPAPVCSPLAAQTQTLSCPIGQTGSIVQTRTSSCAAGASSPTWGAWTTTSSTCTTPTPAAPSAPSSMSVSCASSGTSATLSWPAATNATMYAPRIYAPNTSVSCSSGWAIGWAATGSLCVNDSFSATSVTLVVVPGVTYDAWVHGVNSAGTLSAAATHVPNSAFTCSAPAPTCTALSPQSQTLSCPIGQTGSIVQTRSSSCAVGASSPTWSEWTTTSNTCVTPAPQGPSVPTTKYTFIKHLYSCTLNREADDGGLNTWMGTSGSLYTFYNGFFASQEFANRNMSNTDYVKHLYLCVLFRVADEAGLAHNVARLSTESRDAMLRGFIGGAEFQNGVGMQLQQNTGVMVVVAPQTDNLANALSALRGALEALQKMFR